MKLRGEYWIVDGDIEFAGDGSDMDHESHVLQYCRRQLLDALGSDYSEEEFVCETVLSDGVEQYFREDRGLTQNEIDQVQFSDWLYKNAEREFPCSPDIVLGAYDKVGDLREFAMRDFGWVWVRTQQVGIWNLNEQNLNMISRGLEKIFEEEGFECDGIPESESSIPGGMWTNPEFLGQEVEIRVYSDDARSYFLTMQEILDRSFSVLGLGQGSAETEARSSDQLRRQELRAMHSCYTHVGD